MLHHHPGWLQQFASDAIVAREDEVVDGVAALATADLVGRFGDDRPIPRRVAAPIARLAQWVKSPIK